jgi:hypothetical protein
MLPNLNTATLREIYSRAHAVGIGGDRIQIKDLRKNKNTSHWQVTIENRATTSGGTPVVAVARVMAAQGALEAMDDAASGHLIQPGQAMVFDVSADVQVVTVDIQGVQPADWTTEDAVTVQITVTEEVFSPACREADKGACKTC